MIYLSALFDNGKLQKCSAKTAKKTNRPFDCSELEPNIDKLNSSTSFPENGSESDPENSEPGLDSSNKSPPESESAKKRRKLSAQNAGPTQDDAVALSVTVGCSSLLIEETLEPDVDVHVSCKICRLEILSNNPVIMSRYDCQDTICEECFLGIPLSATERERHFCLRSPQFSECSKSHWAYNPMDCHSLKEFCLDVLDLKPITTEPSDTNAARVTSLVDPYLAAADARLSIGNQIADLINASSDDTKPDLSTVGPCGGCGETGFFKEQPGSGDAALLWRFV